MRAAALRFISVKKRVVRHAAQDEIELPREIGGVAHAGACAVPEIGRVGMSRVAGKENSADAPCARKPALERIDVMFAGSRRWPALSCR